MNSFPSSYACFDTVTGRYVSGARGQYAFESTSGLKRSVSQSLKYTIANLHYLFLTQNGLESNLTTDYEIAMKLPHTYGPHPDVTAIEQKMLSLVGISRRYHTDIQTAPYYDQAKGFKFQFNKQKRYQVHEACDVTIKIL